MVECHSFGNSFLSTEIFDNKGKHRDQEWAANEKKKNLSEENHGRDQFDLGEGILQILKHIWILLFIHHRWKPNCVMSCKLFTSIDDDMIEFKAEFPSARRPFTFTIHIQSHTSHVVVAPFRFT